MQSTQQKMESLLDSSGVRFQGFEAGGRHLSSDEVEAILGPFLTHERRLRIDEVLAGRTYGIVPVIEGLVNIGNVSAVMRTAEGLGFQAFHIIRGDTRYKKSVRTSQGAHKWLDVSVWNTASECISALKSSGYQIVVTHLNPEARPVTEVDFLKPTAIVFGNERGGVSDEMLSESDITAILPSPGFVQSYNISVAAAMALFAAHDARVRAFGRNGDLCEEDHSRLRADFYLRSVQNSERILRRHLGLE